MNAAGIARRLGAVRQGHNWRAPCLLGCGYTLSIAEGEDGRLLLHCHGGCEYGKILPALVEYGLLDGDVDPDLPAVAPSAVHFAEAVQRRIESARDIYHQATQDPQIIGAYLRSRGLKLTSPVLRFSAAAPHRLGGRLPAVVAPVVDVSGELTGVHLTYIRPNGAGKADLPRDLQRECRGTVRGGAIRLAVHDPKRELLVGEGLESTAAASQLLKLPGWAAVSADNLKGALMLPPEVHRVVIAADNDANGAGQRAALGAYERWSHEGRVVRIKLPPNAGDDFNDVIRSRHERRRQGRV